MSREPGAPGDFVDAEMRFHGAILEVRVRSKSTLCRRRVAQGISKNVGEAVSARRNDQRE
ncbi:hypothetical protein PSm6_11530 [Pseudomonas solani]|uniref:Uncharacterized protein n=1 Tax=Pseudomonas solani TaxID=2731552 RepID=A0ABN6BNU6_9PSED|nr:hypothetical protein PSm6_11530 [Pseudomonas solani]